MAAESSRRFTKSLLKPGSAAEIRQTASNAVRNATLTVRRADSDRARSIGFISVLFAGRATQLCRENRTVSGSPREERICFVKHCMWLAVRSCETYSVKNGYGSCKWTRLVFVNDWASVSGLCLILNSELFFKKINSLECLIFAGNELCMLSDLCRS